MSRLTPSQFRGAFDAVIEPADEIVVVYSGIWTFGHQFGLPVRDLPRMLIDQMLESIGPRRTLLLPAYTYAFARTRVYVPETMVPETGILPQTCLVERPCVRTRSALNSFLAMGPKAKELAQVVGQTLWGEDSLAALFERALARIVVLGIPWKDACGFLHRIEEALLRREIENAGFRLIEEGRFLRNPDDPSDEIVFRAKVPVDEFVLKFVRP